MKKLVAKEFVHEDLEIELDDTVNSRQEDGFDFDLELEEQLEEEQEEELQSDDEEELQDWNGDELEEVMVEQSKLDVEKETVEVEMIDLTGFTPSICEQPARVVGEAGVLSVVQSDNGKRVALSKELLEQLGNPNTIQIGLSDNQMVIAENLGDDFTSYPLSKSGAKKIIYRSELVKQITERYNLDFSKRTSITFHDANYKKMGNTSVALITVK